MRDWKAYSSTSEDKTSLNPKDFFNKNNLFVLIGSGLGVGAATESYVIGGIAAIATTAGVAGIQKFINVKAGKEISDCRRAIESDFLKQDFIY